MPSVWGSPVTKLAAPYRRTTSEDVPELPELVNIAGDGLPLYLWAKLAEAGESPWDVATNRAKRGMGGFAFGNTVVREEGGKIAACLIGYPLSSAPQVYSHNDVPAMVAPLHELENIVPGTWFINVLATFPEYRGRGFGTELLHVAERLAHDAQCAGLSLIVSDANAGARRLYERHGYNERATRPIVKEDWEHAGQNWVLLLKDFRQAA
jgi:ribosomal protein S18 acetylase RimI-like enzyme